MFIEKELNMKEKFEKFIEEKFEDIKLDGGFIIDEIQVMRYMSEKVSEEIDEFIKTNADLLNIHVDIENTRMNGVNKVIKLRAKNDTVKNLINGIGMYDESIVDDAPEEASEELWNIFFYNLYNIYGNPFQNFDFEKYAENAWNSGFHPYGCEIDKWIAYI